MTPRCAPRVMPPLPPRPRDIPIARPCVGEEEWQALREPIMSGWLTQGPKVEAFERRFAELHEVRHAVATTSCTTALHLALLAVGTEPGDEIIVPAFTWVATANAVLYCGATPVFVDVDPLTFNMDVEQALAAVTERTRAVMPVHLFGLCADVARLRAGLPENVAVVEDAACAAGARLDERFAGSLGDAAAFSFHPRKSVTTGEGGMITTDDDDVATRVRRMRNHGASVSEEQRHTGPQPWLMADYDVLGFNYRMTDLQGAVGLVQIEKLEGFIAERARRAAWYRDRLGDLGWLRLPQEPPQGRGRHAWQAFVCMVDPARAPMSRNAMMGRLHAAGVATRPGTHAVHMLGYYRERYGFPAKTFPAARACDRNSLALPLHNAMGDEDYLSVVDAIRGLAV